MTPGFLNYETLLGSRTKKRFGNMSPWQCLRFRKSETLNFCRVSGY
jgi:hypothetical protein